MRLIKRDIPVVKKIAFSRKHCKYLFSGFIDEAVERGVADTAPDLMVEIMTTTDFLDWTLEQDPQVVIDRAPRDCAVVPDLRDETTREYIESFAILLRHVTTKILLQNRALVSDPAVVTLADSDQPFALDLRGDVLERAFGGYTVEKVKEEGLAIIATLGDLGMSEVKFFPDN